MAPSSVTAAAVLAAVAFAAGAARIEAAKTDITVDYDKKFSFVGLRTWAWHPDGPGDVRMAYTAQDDPKRVAARVDPVVIPAVERALHSRGFETAAAHPDLLVHYYVLVTLKQSAQYQGQFLAPVPDWGVPPFSPSTTSLEIYPVGTLIIDIADPARRAVVWRGAAARKIDVERPDAERRVVLEHAIRDLLKRFPPKR